MIFRSNPKPLSGIYLIDSHRHLGWEYSNLDHWLMFHRNHLQVPRYCHFPVKYRNYSIIFFPITTKLHFVDLSKF